MRKNFDLEAAIPADFSEKEEHLTRFVHLRHGSQTRKYTGLPYVVHLVTVAALVKKYTGNGTAVATALCHDLFEDTTCSEKELKKALLHAGYSEKELEDIVRYTWHLTDRFIKSRYPRLKRRERKLLEAERIKKEIASVSASVKMADMYDNLADLLINDREFAGVYLQECQLFLPHLKVGDIGLYELFLQLAAEAETRLTGR